MIRSLGQQLNNAVSKAKDVYQTGVDNVNQWSPNAQSGDVQIAGTNNGGLTNPYAPDTSQGQYGGSVGNHPVVWASQGGGDRGNNFQTAQQNADPLFFSPGMQMPTAGEQSANYNSPNAYRYPGSNGWVSGSGQPMNKG